MSGRNLVPVVRDRGHEVLARDREDHDVSDLVRVVHRDRMISHLGFGAFLIVSGIRLGKEPSFTPCR